MVKKGKWSVPGKLPCTFVFLFAHDYSGYKEKFGDLNLM